MQKINKNNAVLKCQYVAFVSGFSCRWFSDKDQALMQDLSYKSALISNVLIGGRVSKALIMVIYMKMFRPICAEAAVEVACHWIQGWIYRRRWTVCNRMTSHAWFRFPVWRMIPTEQKCKCCKSSCEMLRGSLHAVFSFSLGRTSHCPWKFFDDRGAVAQRCRKITKAFPQAKQQNNRRK